MYRREGFLSATLLPLLTLLCACRASVPFIAWSNRDVFSQVSADDLLETFSLVSDLSKDLGKLDFVIIFTSERLEFDDIARYGGLYGDETDAPLAPLQAAMTTAASSVWGETEQADILIEELPRLTSTSLRYLTEITEPQLLRMTGALQLLVVELPNGWDRRQTLAEHGLKIGHVMESIDKLGADYAVFYTIHHRGSMHHRDKRANVISPKQGNNKTDQVCFESAVIAEAVNSTGKNNFCTLMCIHSTTVDINGTTNPLLAVYWPSWLELATNGSNNGCLMTTFEFDPNSASCDSSSLHLHYPKSQDLMNVTSNSIKAIMTGKCPLENGQSDITLQVEFMFFSGSHLVPLPGKQVLLPGYWTMQLFVTDITNASSSEPQYMTRYQQDLNHEATTERGNITLYSGLFYPFSVPSSASYSCLSHKDHLFLPRDQGQSRASGNPNRFVVTRNPFSNSSQNLTDGPVLQFVGLQVQSFGNVYGAGPNTKLVAFSSAYDCQGYFDITSWMGTVVVLIITLMLYLATLALFSTQTVDRFDDPRGRTISVENLH